MPYCPQCLTEYVEGATECADCQVPLEPGSPPARAAAASGADESPDVDLVLIRTFSGPTALMDAELARNLLATQGIPSVLPGEISAETLPGIDVVQLLVRNKDAEQAAEVLKSYLDSPGLISEE